MPVAVVAVCCVAVVCLGKKQTPIFAGGLGRIAIIAIPWKSLATNFSYVGLKRTTICLINQGLSSIQKGSTILILVVDLQGSFFK